MNYYNQPSMQNQMQHGQYQQNQGPNQPQQMPGYPSNNNGVRPMMQQGGHGYQQNAQVQQQPQQQQYIRPMHADMQQMYMQQQPQQQMPNNDYMRQQMHAQQTQMQAQQQMHMNQGHPQQQKQQQQQQPHQHQQQQQQQPSHQQIEAIRQRQYQQQQQQQQQQMYRQQQMQQQQQQQQQMQQQQQLQQQQQQQQQQMQHQQQQLQHQQHQHIQQQTQQQPSQIQSNNFQPQEMQIQQQMAQQMASQQHQQPQGFQQQSTPMQKQPSQNFQQQQSQYHQSQQMQMQQQKMQQMQMQQAAAQQQIQQQIPQQNHQIQQHGGMNMTQASQMQRMQQQQHQQQHHQQQQQQQQHQQQQQQQSQQQQHPGGKMLNSMQIQQGGMQHDQHGMSFTGNQGGNVSHSGVMGQTNNTSQSGNNGQSGNLNQSSSSISLQQSGMNQSNMPHSQNEMMPTGMGQGMHINQQNQQAIQINQPSNMVPNLNTSGNSHGHHQQANIMQQGGNISSQGMQTSHPGNMGPGAVGQANLNLSGNMNQTGLMGPQNMHQQGSNQQPSSVNQSNLNTSGGMTQQGMHMQQSGSMPQPGNMVQHGSVGQTMHRNQQNLAQSNSNIIPGTINQPQNIPQASSMGSSTVGQASHVANAGSMNQPGSMVSQPTMLQQSLNQSNNIATGSTIMGHPGSIGPGSINQVTNTPSSILNPASNNGPTSVNLPQGPNSAAYGPPSSAQSHSIPLSTVGHVTAPQQHSVAHGMLNPNQLTQPVSTGFPPMQNESSVARPSSTNAPPTSIGPPKSSAQQINVGPTSVGPGPTSVHHHLAPTSVQNFGPNSIGGPMSNGVFQSLNVPSTGISNRTQNLRNDIDEPDRTDVLTDFKMLIKKDLRHSLTEINVALLALVRAVIKFQNTNVQPSSDIDPSITSPVPSPDSNSETLDNFVAEQLETYNNARRRFYRVVDNIHLQGHILLSFVLYPQRLNRIIEVSGIGQIQTVGYAQLVQPFLETTAKLKKLHEEQAKCLTRRAYFMRNAGYADTIRNSYEVQRKINYNQLVEMMGDFDDSNDNVDQWKNDLGDSFRMEKELTKGSESFLNSGIFQTNDSFQTNPVSIVGKSFEAPSLKKSCYNVNDDDDNIFDDIFQNDTIEKLDDFSKPSSSSHNLLKRPAPHSPNLYPQSISGNHGQFDQILSPPRQNPTEFTNFAAKKPRTDLSLNEWSSAPLEDAQSDMYLKNNREYDPMFSSLMDDYNYDDPDECDPPPPPPMPKP